MSEEREKILNMVKSGAFLTLLPGLVGLIVGIWSRNVPWLHVDVRERNGNNVRVSLPLLLPLTHRN